MLLRNLSHIHGVTKIAQTSTLLCPHLPSCTFILSQEMFTTCPATSPPSSGLSQGGVIAIGVVFGLLSLAAVVIAALIVVAVMYKWLRGGGKAYS